MFTYTALLAGCLLVTAPLEILLHTRVYARPLRLLASLLPVALLFLAWDAYAVHHGQWSYDRHRVLGIDVPGHLPVEEVGFFLVVPTCAILALEAVRSVTGWPLGDE